MLNCNYKNIKCFVSDVQCPVSSESKVDCRQNMIDQNIYRSSDASRVPDNKHCFLSCIFHSLTQGVPENMAVAYWCSRATAVFFLGGGNPVSKDIFFHRSCVPLMFTPFLFILKFSHDIYDQK